MALRELLASFGFAVDDRPLQRADLSLQGLVSSVQKFAAGIAGGFFVTKVLGFATHMAEVGDELATTSERIGVSTDALQSWRYAAQQANIGADALDGSMGRLVRAAAEAAGGSSEMASAFRKLGVAVNTPAGDLKNADQLLLEVGTAISEIPNASERAAAAMKLFGRQGTQLLPLFANGAEGIAGMQAEFARLGGGFSQEFIERAQTLDETMNRWDATLAGVKSRIAVALMPWMDRLVNGIGSLMDRFTALTDGTHVVEMGLVALGLVLSVLAIQWLAAFAVPIGIALLVALAIGAIIIVVDDLIALFSGGRSVIGAFLDDLFGVGTAAKVVHDMRLGWRLLIVDVKSAGTAVSDFFTNTLSFANAWTSKVGAAIAGVWMGMVTTFKTALAEITGSAARAASFFGVDLSVEAANTQREALSARQASAVVRERTNAQIAQQTQNNVTINAAQADAREVARIVRQQVIVTSEQERRATAAALAQEAE